MPPGAGHRNYAEAGIPIFEDQRVLKAMEAGDAEFQQAA